MLSFNSDPCFLMSSLKSKRLKFTEKYNFAYCLWSLIVKVLTYVLKHKYIFCNTYFIIWKQVYIKSKPVWKGNMFRSLGISLQVGLYICICLQELSSGKNSDMVRGYVFLERTVVWWGDIFFLATTLTLCGDTILKFCGGKKKQNIILHIPLFPNY